MSFRKWAPTAGERVRNRVRLFNAFTLLAQKEPLWIIWGDGKDVRPLHQGGGRALGRRRKCLAQKGEERIETSQRRSEAGRATRLAPGSTGTELSLGGGSSAKKKKCPHNFIVRLHKKYACPLRTPPANKRKAVRAQDERLMHAFSTCLCEVPREEVDRQRSRANALRTRRNNSSKSPECPYRPKRRYLRRAPSIESERCVQIKWSEEEAQGRTGFSTNSTVGTMTSHATHSKKILKKQGSLAQCPSVCAGWYHGDTHIGEAGIFQGGKKRGIATMPYFDQPEKRLRGPWESESKNSSCGEGWHLEVICRALKPEG